MPIESDLLPTEPVDRVIKPLARFLHVEAASGLVLLAATITALVLANSPWSGVLDVFKTQVGFSFGSFEAQHSLKHWINDGLMVIFFFVIGLEVKREVVLGELQDARKAALPIAAALGGMILPAGIYLALQFGEPGASGWGIPMATDIAFVVGCMALLGERIPHSLRVMLLSLAIADDIGAILVIAIGYTNEINWLACWLAVGGLALIVVCQRTGVRSFAVYTILGLFVWFACHESHIHATIAGAIIGLMTPASHYINQGRFAKALQRAADVMQGDWEQMAHRADKVRQFQRAARETISPLEFLEGTLHPWVGFLIMPVFALANAGVEVHLKDLAAPISLAVTAGLVLGKPLGIVLFSWLAVRLRLAALPEGVNWKLVVGGGCLAGIGFTMALFIADLAVSEELLDTAKIGVLIGSLVSAIVGMALLMMVGGRSSQTAESAGNPSHA